ncbi:hypothetical protein [Sinorhizobium americanum]|uniref:Uncharacterized protein n=1 Tax=Sinorhizobium americanum TaxID=194963 RepID=A0A4R2BXR3_9HYPH|nr:hypothetical protein [Sinorhizobium americanum]TCN32476.1 hypothetical protein EV184_104142 [Sinorhizobium americanum]
MSIQLDIETNLHLNENIASSDQVIYYVDGPVGSHKTSSMYRFVAACPNAKFVIGTPTNEMTDQIAGGLEAHDISCLPIHRKTDDGKRIEGSAVRYRRALLEGGSRIIAINHDVALKLALDKMDCDHIRNPDLFAADNYRDIHLIIDEILSVYKRFTLKGMTLSNGWVSTYFNTFKSNEASEYYHLTLNERGMAAWSNGFLEEQQPLSAKQRAILDHTVNERYRVAVSVKDFDQLNSGDRTSLSFFVTVRPSVLQQYRSATIIGANFKKSMLYKMWKDDVNFQPHPYIEGDYDDFSHKHDAGVTINHYYFCEPTFSKTRLKEIGYETVFDKASVAVESILKQHNNNQNMSYLFAVNNPEKESDPDYRWLTEAEGGYATRISANPRGQNGHKDKNASAFLAAVNFSNIDTEFLNSAFNISPSESREAMTYENISQFHGRTSVRVYDATKDLYFFSPDHASALAMHKEFGGEEPIFIDLGFEQFRYDEADDRTDAERQADYNTSRNNSREDKRWSNEGTRQYDGFTLAIWVKRGDSFPDFLEGLEWQDILHFTEDQTKAKRSKTNLPQIREGFFKDHSNHRTSGNIESTKMLQMDVDGSAVSPETFSNFLADELGLTHVIYNSISSTGDNPRFHFLIPLDKAVNRSVHERIFAMVAERIAAEYEGIEFGLEIDRKSFNLPIYSACLPKKAGGGIFIAREAAFLDVDAYLARRLSVAAPVADTKPAAAKARNTPIAKIDHLEAIRIVSEIALEHAKPQHRDAAFKLAGQALIYEHKMAPDEAVQALETTLHMFGKDQNAPRRLVNSLISADGYQRNL